METLPPVSTQAPSHTEVEQPVFDLDLLVREARARQRRRRLRLLAGLLALVGVGGLVYGSVGAGGRSGLGVEAIPNGPVVNLRAFAGQGRLAFLSRGTLWLLDGQTSTLRRIARPHDGFRPATPTFSPDGKWLAFLKTRSGRSYSQLWIARANGSDAHLVPKVQAVALYGWSPSSDVLAVGTGPEQTKQPCPCNVQTRLRIVSPDGIVRTLARSSWIYGAAWSPNGASIAAAEITYPTSKLVVYPAAGGPGTTWFTIGAHQRLDGMNQILFQIAGWWRRLGIAFWVFGDGAVRNPDATPLDLVKAAGSPPRLLGQTLSNGGTDATAAGAAGEVALVTDHGGAGRAAWQGKQIKLCGPTSCHALRRGPGTLTVDPAWSANGKTLAYAQAPTVLVSPWTQKAIAAWYGAHHLRLYNTATGRTRSVPAADGATAINWSANGRSLLYVRGDALWLLPTLGSKPVRIATPLYPPHNWPQYFAEIAWASRFAWSSR